MRAYPLLFAVIAACKPAAGPEQRPYPLPDTVAEGEVVAQIGPVTLTTKEIERRINGQSPFLKVQLKDPKQLEKYVQNEIRLELLAQEGWDQRLYDDPKIKAELKRLIVQRVMNDKVDDLKDKLDAKDGELARVYKAKEAEYNKPERIRLSQIVRYVESDADRKRERALLERLKKDVLAANKKNKQGVFGTFARKHSMDEATKNGGGDLQFLDRTQLTERYGEVVAKTIFEDAKIGDHVIADAENAVVLFKKTGRRRAVIRTFEMVRAQLRGQVIAEKREAFFNEFVDSLKKKRGVQVNEAAFSKVKLDMKDNGGS